jgi:uncharacterized membrane protein YagU involved in acid resistance
VRRRPFHPLSWAGAGLAGGAVFLAVELVLLPIVNHLPADWFLRLLAALITGPVALTHPAGQNGALLVCAFIAHLTFSLAFAFVLCRVEDSLPFLAAIAASALLGLALYMINFYLLTLAFPWFATIRGGVTIAAHVAYGVTTTVTHKGLRTWLSEPEAGPAGEPPPRPA